MIIPFDILYEGLCNRVRSAGKSDVLLSLIKKEDNEQLRVKALLGSEPDLYSLLERNISESFEKKDEVISTKLWDRGREGKSLELLTEAISYCPIPPVFEEKVIGAFEDINKAKEVVSSFLTSALKENPDVSPEVDDKTRNCLFARILYDRARILFSRQRFASSFKDFIRAWLLGIPKSLELSYHASVCFCEFGEVDTSKELLQCCAQHLRSLTMSNEDKSVWTMNIVRVLKSVEASKKIQSNQKQAKTSSSEKFPYVLVDKSHLQNDTNLPSFSAIFSGKSERIKESSEALELKYSVEQGRHMVANKDIPSGSTIIVEEPYAWTLTKANYHKFCTWCLLIIEDGIPCSTCAAASFCNNVCRRLAMNSFHEKECRIVKLLDSSQKLGNMALLCFRTILKTPQKTIKKFSYLSSQRGRTEDCNLSQHQLLMGLNEQEDLDSSNYLSVFSQTPNSEQRQAADLLKRTVSAIYLTLGLKFVGYITPNDVKASLQESSSSCPMSEIELSIAGLLLRNIQSASCNAYGINYIEKKINYGEEDEKHRLKIDEIGGATYPIISTTNHTCNPNAYRINAPGKTCLVKTLRMIRKGEEVFDCYGPLYLTEARQERMGRLQTQYLFRCGCPPCTEDWPGFGKLRGLPIQFKCSNCHCALKLLEQTNGSHSNCKIKCPYCDQIIDLKNLRDLLSTHKERFSLAKSSILSERFQPFDKDIEGIICEYIETCQQAYLDPCIESVEAQEVLKLFWNLSIRNA